MATSAPQSGLRGLSYAQARRLLLAAGLLVLLIVAGVQYARRVETAEVVAILLFIPVFAAFVFWDVIGGVVAGVLASLAYVAVRYPAIHQLGSGRFTGLIISRAAALIAFGAIGGWAMRQLESSLTKLDLYDQVDDATGLYNARFFVQDTDLEVARAKRYQTIFSVALVDIPTAALDGLGRRQRAGTLRQLGRLLSDSIRTVDRAVHGRDGANHRLAIVLPETGPEGARVFTERLADRVAEFLRQRGAQAPGALTHQAVTFPENEVALQRVRDEFAAIDRAEHPEHPEAAEA